MNRKDKMLRYNSKMSGAIRYFRSKSRQTGKLLLLAIMLTAMVLPVFFSGSLVPTQVEAAADSGYVIENMTVDIELTDDNVYKVRQQVDVNYFERSRGIFIHIPYLMRVDLPGAEENRYRAIIKNIQVDGYEFEAYKESPNQIIRIGDPDVYIDGRHTYNVFYSFDVGMDHSEEADFLYFNIIGPQWTTSMEKVTFLLNMPHDFDASEINFTVGSYGSEDNTRVDYQINGRDISGTVVGGLNAFEGLTVYLELPDGYFTGAKHNSALDIIAIILSLAAIAVVLYLYIRYGRDRYVPETVEFYAPNGIDPAHAGFLADGAADSKDLISLIMYWADLGYLQIIEQDKKISLRRLHVLPEESPKYQLTIFNGIFSHGEYVVLDTLEEVFYKTVETGKSQLTGAYQDKIIESSSRKAQGFAVLLALLPLIFSLGRALLSKPFDSTELIFIAGGVNAAFTLVWLPVLISNRMRWRIKNKVARVLPIIFAAIVIPVLNILNIAAIRDITRDPYYASFIAALASMVIIPFAVIMDRRTAEGQQLYSRLMGFRNFIVRAEKARLEALVNENPSYFYDVLPYAYVLGVSNKWAKNFEGLEIRPPEWYRTDTLTTFTALHFANQMNRTASKMNSVMISQPSSSSGGGGGFGGGGGGFSGGGFGGGGGGRW